MIAWPTWPSRGPADFHVCGLIVVVTVTNKCPRCNHCASNSCPTLCTLKCRPSVHVNVQRCATDFSLSHAESPQMPRIEPPVTTQGSRKDHARFTQGVTHDSRNEHARFMERVRVVHSASITLAYALFSRFPPRTCCQRCPHQRNSVAAHPIRLGYRYDAGPLRASVGFRSTRRLPSGRSVDKC